MWLRVPLIDSSGRFEERVWRQVPEIARLQTAFERAWGITYTAHRFVPAMNPPSITRADLRYLREGYVCGEKTDGIRMQVVLLDQRYLFLVDRSFRLLVPCSPENVEAARTRDLHWVPRALEHSSKHDLCVLDGEWVSNDSTELLYEIEPVTGGRASRVELLTTDSTQPPTLTLFDVVATRGQSLVSIPFESRQKLLGLVNLEWGRARVSVKRWYPLSSAPEVRRASASTCDGLILMNRLGTLSNGIAPPNVCYKWKEEHMVDVYDLEGVLWIGRGRDIVPCSQETLGRGRLSLPTNPRHNETHDFEEMTAHATIWELEFVKETDNRWTIRRVRERPDKVTANDARVFEMTLLNAIEDIRVEELQTSR